MNKKSWLIPLVLVIIFAACSYYYYTIHSGYTRTAPAGSTFPTLTTILPDFPAGLPVPADAQIVGYRDSTTTAGGSNSSFEYMSNTTLTSVISTYKQYFSTHGWTTVSLPSPTGSQTVSAKYPGHTLQVSATSVANTGQVMVSVAETTTSVNPFPADFPIEKGATAVTNSIATSTKAIITYVRDYTSAQTLALDNQTFSTYFSKNGFHVGPGPLNTSATAVSMTATKTNQSYQVVFVEDPKTGTVYVDVRLTFYLK